MTNIPNSISLENLTLLSLTAERGTEPIMNEDTPEAIKSLLISLENITQEFEALSFPELTASRARFIHRSKLALNVAVRNLQRSIQV